MKKYFYSIVILSFVIVLASCSKKIHFTSSAVVPAASGTIRIKKDNNNNYSISINVLHLAEPDKLTPPKKTYVVWLETKEHGQKNLGQLNTSTGLFSKTLKGSLKTVTPYQPVSIYITAEDEGARTYPGQQVVLISEPVR